MMSAHDHVIAASLSIDLAGRSDSGNGEFIATQLGFAQVHALLAIALALTGDQRSRAHAFISPTTRRATITPLGKTCEVCGAGPDEPCRPTPERPL